MFSYLTTRVPGGYRVTHVNEPGVFFTVTSFSRIDHCFLWGSTGWRNFTSY